MRSRVLLVVGALAASLVLGAAPVGAGRAPSSDGYLYQSEPPEPLGDAKQSILRGTRNADGSCHYEYPEITVSEPGVIIEVRDIAIDGGRCRKIIEQGRSQETPTDPVKGEEQITEQVPEATAGRAGSPALLATSTASGYNWTWWEDILGIKMTQDRTNISWSYNGSCSLVGSTSGQWTWATGTGWQIVSNSGNELESCAYYRGETKSTFKNSWFCAPLPTVYTYYYYVRAYGQENGSITGSRSTDSVDECAPFWMHYSVQKVT